MRLSGKAGIILGLFLSLAVIAGIWFGYTKTQVANHAAAVSDRDDSQEKAAYYESKIKEINDTGVDYLGSLFTQTKAADKLLPGKIDAGAIAQTYPSMATSLGLTVISFDPGKATADYAPFRTQFEGTYEQITTWLDTLENAENLITVGSMQLTSGSEDSAGAFTLSMEIRFHSFPEAELTARASSDKAPVTPTDIPES